MEEKMQRLHLAVVELIDALDVIRTEKQAFKQELDKLTSLNNELEAKLNYQQKLIETLNQQNQRLSGNQSQVVSKIDKIESLLSRIEQAY